MRKVSQGRQSKLSDEEIIRLYTETNTSAHGISKLAGIHYQRINTLILDNNIELKNTNKSLGISEDRIIELYTKHNKSISYIAKVANCLPKTIKRRLRRKKITLRCTAHKNGLQIREHTLYLMINPVYPEWVKLGRTTNLYKRLSTYQTCSPFRDMKIIYNIDTEYAVEIEWEFKHKYDSPYEWYKMSVEDAKKEILTYIKDNE